MAFRAGGVRTLALCMCTLAGPRSYYDGELRTMLSRHSKKKAGGGIDERAGTLPLPLPAPGERGGGLQPCGRRRCPPAVLLLLLLMLMLRRRRRPRAEGTSALAIRVSPSPACHPPTCPATSADGRLPRTCPPLPQGTQAAPSRRASPAWWATHLLSPTPSSLPHPFLLSWTRASRIFQQLHCQVAHCLLFLVFCACAHVFHADAC